MKALYLFLVVVVLFPTVDGWVRLWLDNDRQQNISEQCDARLTACIESKYARPKVCR